MDKLKILPNPHVDLNNARNLQKWKESEEIMDKIKRLHSLFPRGSKDFFKANETNPIPGIPDTHPKHYEATPLDRVAKRKKESLGRVEVRYRLCRVRPLDPDNAAGSTKDLTDGLCRCGLIPGDDPTQITLIVEQEKVKSYYFEHTQIEITWPDYDSDPH